MSGLNGTEMALLSPSNSFNNSFDILVKILHILNIISTKRKAKTLKCIVTPSEEWIQLQLKGFD